MNKLQIYIDYKFKILFYYVIYRCSMSNLYNNLQIVIKFISNKVIHYCDNYLVGTTFSTK